jgi:uncharacterized repeat protein (TIGR02543 family)
MKAIRTEGPLIIHAKTLKLFFPFLLWAMGSILSSLTAFADYSKAPAASDVCFVVKNGDATSGNMGSIADENITFQIPIDRYFGKKDQLLANGGLPKTVTLKMIVFDVDEAEGEVDEVTINGQCFQGSRFHGADETWSLNSFSIPTSIINLPSAPGNRAMNTVSIDISIGDPGSWVTEVDWAALEIPAPPPVVISHGVKDSAVGNAAWYAFLNSENGMKDLKAEVEALGLPVETFSYGANGFNSISAGATQLATAISGAKSKYKVDKVTILCHSMGGLKARHYTTEIDPDAQSVDRVIQIATPNGGSGVAELRWLLGPIWQSVVGVVNPASWELSENHMANYNSRHPLNRGVKYLVLAGNNGNKWYSFNESNWFGPGDGFVSVKSAHTMVPAHPQSPVKDSRATHGGLVTANSGMVHEVISKYLREDLLEPKHPDGTRYAYGNTVSLDDAISALDESLATYAVATATVGSGKTSFDIPFQIAAETQGEASVSFVSAEKVEIASIRSPSGIVYSPNDDRISVSSNEEVTMIDIASAEAGTWTVTATRASGESALPYAVVVKEKESKISLGGDFVMGTVRVGSSFVLELRPTDNGAALTALSGSLSVISPDGTEQNVSLSDVGNGLYRATFQATQTGTYLATAKMTISGTQYVRTFSGTAHASNAAFGSLTDVGPVDDDGDGLYDRLSVSGTISGVDSSASYRVFAQLADQNGSNVVWAATTIKNGANSFRLDFDGADIYGYGPATKYTVSTLRLFEQSDDYEAGIDSRDGAVVFNRVTWTDFTHPFVAVTGTGTDTIIPPSATSSTGAFRVGMDLSYDASVAGTYEYSVTLKTRNGALLGTAYGTVRLPVATGVATTRLQLSFSAAAIAASGVNGPYLVKDLLLWNSTYYFAPAGEYTTHAQRASDFVMAQTVTFNANGGTCTTAKKSYNTGAKYSPLPVATCTGYTFDGWFTAVTGGTKVTAATTVSSASARTLYAHWMATRYTVKFNAGGGKLPKGKKMKAQTMTYGTAAKLRKNVFTRKGWVFAGWSTKKNGAVTYKNGQSVSNLRSDGKTTTLYAAWAKKTYKVAFYANGGRGRMAVQKMTYGKAKNLSANKFTKKGYTFQGWAKSKKGKVVYKNKQKVKDLLRNGKTLKLYAVWKTISLGQALRAGGPSLQFTTGGSKKWFVDTRSFETFVCARSGKISDYQESWIQTTVSGPGTIAFWCKVSCESSRSFLFDHLAFSIDGHEKKKMDEDDAYYWTHCSFKVSGPGKHTIKWSYKKDILYSKASDCAWIDDVVWTPAK